MSRQKEDNHSGSQYINIKAKTALVVGGIGCGFFGLRELIRYIRKRLSDDYYFKKKNGSLQSPRSRFIMNWCFVAFFTLNAISYSLAAINLGEEAAWVVLLSVIPGAFAAGITIGNLVRVYPNVKKVNEIDRHIEELKAELNRLGETISTRKAEAEEFSAFVMDSCREIIEKDRLIVKEPVQEYGSVLSPSTN